MVLKIGMDAGHGKNTAGKRTPDGEREWEFNNAVLQAFNHEMSKYENVHCYRYDDPIGQKDVPLATRTNNAKKDNVDLYISFHHNGFLGVWGTHTGVEVIIELNPNENSLKLAQSILPALVQAYGLKSRGIKKQNLHITREMERGNKEIGVVLVEGGFMDSTIDIVKLRNGAVLDKAGRSMARAVAEAFGLKRHEPVQQITPQPQPTSGVLYRVRESWANVASQKGAYTNLDNAKAIADLYPGYEVYDPSGNAVYPIAVPTPQITPQPTPTPTPPSKKYLKLPADASSWSVYPTNKAPVKANAIGSLNPKKHGGLTYEILGNPQKDVYTIQTRDFGKVNIYATKSNGAIIQ